MNKSSGNLSLTITSKSWNKETEDLFDFEAEDMTCKEFKINSGENTNYILSHKEKIILVKDFSEVKKKVLDKNTSKILGEITSNKSGQFIISNPFNSSKLQSFDKLYLDRLWIVLQKNETRQIQEGDILKLGRVRLKIDKVIENLTKIALKQNINFETNYQNLTGINYLKTNTTGPLINQPNNAINNQNQSFLINNLNQNNSFTCNENEIFANNFNNIYQEKEKKLEEFPHLKEPHYICKICFRADSDLQDPLISPCNCSGSMGYIHYKCLKQCINMKINTKVGENYLCFVWKNFECEICLKEYPKVIKYRNYNYNMVDLNIPYEQYIILDYTLYDDSKKKSFRKGFMVVKVADDSEISIGRTQTNTIKLKDISVSRVHCIFTKKGNKIFVSDKGSKFGTLLYLTKPFTITNSTYVINDKSFTDSTVSLVSGKNLFNIKLAQNWNFFSNFFSQTFCCKCKSTNDDEFALNFEDLQDNEITKVKEYNNLNDSYCDYVLNLETIIKNSDSNNNSFI